MSVFGRFIAERSEYNKENELKPIKKQHECAIFDYVVMSGVHFVLMGALTRNFSPFLDGFVLHFDYLFQLQLTQTDTLMCACLSIKDICAPVCTLQRFNFT